MTYTLYYIAIKSSLHSNDSVVCGLECEEVVALSKKFGESHSDISNGVIIKSPPIQLVNSLSELGYKVVCCSGENELTWTMMPKCEHNCPNSSVYQTLEEIEFERGIWYAALHNDIPRVQHFIEKAKDNVNAKDKSGYTALHYATRNGYFELCKLLLKYGADVNAVTSSGKVSPLHRCASVGHLEMFKLLINSGALINTKDDDGKTVLHRAVEGKHIHIVEEILKIEPLLAKECDKRGNLPKAYAIASKEMQDLLSKYE